MSKNQTPIPKPEPLGDPQPGQPEWHPEPTGDPRPELPPPDSRGDITPGPGPISASKKVDDISKHQSKHDTDPKHDPKSVGKPSPKDKAPGGIRPEVHQPSGGKSRHGETRP